MSGRLEIAVCDDADLARTQGVSMEAVQLLRQTGLIDLHIDTFIPPRLWGYDPAKRHGKGLFRGRFFGHLDFHRLTDGGCTAAMWSITTNPFRSAKKRWSVFQANLARFRGMMDDTGGAFRIARNYSEYVMAREAGAHAVIPAIQGANALQAAPDGVRSIPDGMITRMTLVHLTNSAYGVTSSPLALRRRGAGLSDAGRDIVRQMNEARVFVDLAHINKEGFWEAVEVHDKTQPLLATHTGVDGVRPHWRNLDDAQIRAIADTGGTIGIIFSQMFLKVAGGPRDCGMVLDHMAHIMRIAGDEFVSIGSDYDGAITPPPDMRDGISYVVLVQAMLDRGWSPERIERVLSGNFLRAFEALRP